MTAADMFYIGGAAVLALTWAAFTAVVLDQLNSLEDE